VADDARGAGQEIQGKGSDLTLTSRDSEDPLRMTVPLIMSTPEYQIVWAAGRKPRSVIVNAAVE
jgi:hypothetical protein